MIKVALILCLLPFLAGCATVIHGTTQKIPVTSEPSGANVNVDGTANYTTPVTLELQRKIDHLLTISKEGFKTEVIKIIHTISGVVAGNIIAGGLIGWGIDAASGAQYKLIPETVQIVLKPEGYDKEGPKITGAEREKMRIEYEKINLEREKMGLSPIEIPQDLKQPVQLQQEKGFVVETPKIETSMPEVIALPKEAPSIQPVEFQQEKGIVVETPEVESVKPEGTAVSKEVSDTQLAPVQSPAQNTIIENTDINKEEQQYRDSERRKMYKGRRR